MRDDRRCPECGTSLSGSGSVEGLCTACLLGLGLSDPQAKRSSSRDAADRPRTLEPVGAGVAASHWAMPAELLRQAARRLALAAAGLALAFAVGIVLNNLFAAVGWYTYPHLAFLNVIHGTMVVVSVAMAWIARTGRLSPRRLLVTGLVYEIVFALGISLGDHLEPLPLEAPMHAISWLCLAIAIFPLLVPAPPRWAFAAALASATTWPLVYFIFLLAGKAPAPTRVVAMNVLEVYVAAGLALFTTTVIRRLHELGGYHLEERLDRGGMGEIWRARHRMLARPVAIKLIRPELFGARTPLEAEALVGRFKREAEATAALHSSHTISLHDFGVTPEGVFYYAMELLEGLDLETLVKRFGPVPPERAIYLLTQACESLGEAHAEGLIHRDVKPANMVACRWGHKWDFVKVLDFGLVKANWGLGDDDRITREGTITGTPAYLAPEVALGKRDLDARVDLYGLGCVAYWLLTGQRVFSGSTPMEVVLHHARTKPVPPSARVTWTIPPSLEELVLACLAKEPEARPPSAEWLAEQLARCEIAQPWTPARAREWWEQNVPAVPSPEGASASPAPTGFEAGQTPGSEALRRTP